MTPSLAGGSWPVSPGGNNKGRNQRPLRWRGLMPLVARPEPYRSRLRAGIGTLAAFARLPGGHWARTLAPLLILISRAITPKPPMSRACFVRPDILPSILFIPASRVSVPIRVLASWCGVKTGQNPGCRPSQWRLEQRIYKRVLGCS